MWSNHIFSSKDKEAKSLIFVWFVAQLHSFYELIISQQSDSSGSGAVCYDNFKIEGEKWVQIEREKESMPSCV